MRLQVVTSFLMLAAIAPAAAATITFFESRTAFDAAATGETTHNFEGIVAPTAAQNFQNPGLEYHGVRFSTSGSGPFGTGFVTVYGATLAGQQSSVLNTGTGSILVFGPPNQPGTAYLDVTLPAGVSAFATDLWSQQPFIANVEVTATSGATSRTTTVATPNRPNPAFIGIVSDEPISLIRFRPPQGNSGIVLDNMILATAVPGNGPGPGAAVPEPGTWALMLAGLGSVAWIRRKRG